MADENAIRARAYALWEQEGRPQGRALEHWRQAERDAGPDNQGKQSNNRPAQEIPPAGPHAAPELTNTMATPGAGMLPDPDDPANPQQAPSG